MSGYEDENERESVEEFRKSLQSMALGATDEELFPNLSSTLSLIFDSRSTKVIEGVIGIFEENLQMYLLMVRRKRYYLKRLNDIYLELIKQELEDEGK